jgi:hypothetical protein
MFVRPNVSSPNLPLESMSKLSMVCKLHCELLRELDFGSCSSSISSLYILEIDIFFVTKICSTCEMNNTKYLQILFEKEEYTVNM